MVTCPVVVLGYKTQRRLGAVIEQLLCTSPSYLHSSTSCLSITLVVTATLVVEPSLVHASLFRSEEWKDCPTWDPPKYVWSSRFVGAYTDVFQIVSRVEDLTEYQRYRVEYLGNLVFDDLVWHQSIVSLERLQTFRGGLRADPDDAVFWQLLMRGVLDMEPEERPMDASTRAVRYSAVMGDRLWAMVQGERLRVCGLHSHDLIFTNHLDTGGTS